MERCVYNKIKRCSCVDKSGLLIAVYIFSITCSVVTTSKFYFPLEDGFQILSRSFQVYQIQFNMSAANMRVVIDKVMVSPSSVMLKATTRRHEECLC